jgi:spore coat protein JB
MQRYMNLNRDKMMKQIQAYSFACYDALLYLDSHPQSKCAMEYYNKHKALEKKAMYEYEKHFGPVTAPTEAYSWEWTKGPWPWQNENDCKE